jgi:hypothetical protein
VEPQRLRFYNKRFLFEDLKLEANAPDSVIWRTCQQHGLVLITGNRNAFGLDSLEEVIRNENSSTALPVFTISNPRRFLKDKDYANRVADTVLRYLFDMELYKGTGRLYVP